MRFIETFREGNHISDVYLCKTKQIALTKNGKEYGSLVLQDKTGTVNFTKQKMEKSPEIKFQGLLFLWEGGFFLHCKMLY